MGGTSCDLALGIDGEVQTNRLAKVDGLPIRLPALDLHTIGAGGGSVAYLDGGQALRVGPRSAGRLPGAACYDRGGIEPTVTDANLILGRLPPTGLLGGQLPVNGTLAMAAIRRIADPLGLSIEEAAAGIVRVVNAGMVRQMRILTVEQGVDPRSCTLVAFGGSGPGHAVELARELEIPEVLIPPIPGVTSALGLLLSDLRHDRVQTVLLRLQHNEVTPATATFLTEVFARLLTDVLSDAPPEVGAEPTIIREVEMRYVRQSHELRVRVPTGIIDEALLHHLIRLFDCAHDDRFGYHFPDEPVLIVNALVTSLIRSLRAPVALAVEYQQQTMPYTRAVWFEGQSHQTEIVDRALLYAGMQLDGPVIIEQLDCTTVVPPRASVRVDEYGNLIIRASLPA